MIQWQERQLFVNQLSMPNFKIPQESRIGWHYTNYCHKINSMLSCVYEEL
ncbi:MAG: hypothetical protein HY813_01055 [Candidatus Portnoybacteria bacterium]|nr:hypothetical protein [Candidatus Portnoybacteria bacterium]